MKEGNMNRCKDGDTLKTDKESVVLENISHEIRTQLAVVVGLAEIQMRKKTLPPDVINAFSDIYKSGNHLLDSFSKIFDPSNLNGDKLDLSAHNYCWKEAGTENDAAHDGETPGECEPMPYGSVLVVDDTQTNLYVAEKFFEKYELSVETVESGFEAIDKIKNGNVYDIVFMDYMMPEMSGIEALGKIREWGYAHPVVAFTAAVDGKEEMFLEKGFDGFASKPIDKQQMDVVLKKLIRDRKAPGEIEAAMLIRETIKNKKGLSDMPLINSKYAKSFSSYTKNNIARIEEILNKKSFHNDEDLLMYIVNMSAIKDSLAGVGEWELSAVAGKLAQGGKDKKLNMMTLETPVFLEALKATIKKISPLNEAG